MVPSSADPNANRAPVTFHPDVMAVNAGVADPTVDKCQAAPDTSALTIDIPLHASPIENIVVLIGASIGAALSNGGLGGDSFALDICCPRLPETATKQIKPNNPAVATMPHPAGRAPCLEGTTGLSP
ncbi:hypothetical protein ABZP12_04348 (plasmid) [Xanthomonas euvesicatoria]